MRVWNFNIGDHAVINRKAIVGLPDNVGDLIQIADQLDYGSYDYRVKLPDGTYTKVKEIELNKINSDDSILKINIGDTYLNSKKEKGKIILIDYLYRQCEIEYIDGSMEVVDISNVVKEGIEC
ncbi:hypothetical protein KDN24_06955 [Bacillus sp. Bva_UNVM-123]|uniref:hypothetical protein n=1 Tax=Bacillus sp. Bva_UNVM-123 TaxID=2829798 RepID=UPI00391FA61A